MDYKGKKVWITGASSGIGKALALAFAKRGAVLLLSSRRADALREVAEACQKAGAADTLVLPLDMGKHQEVKALGERISGEQGGIDLLINNAGISQRSLVKDTAFEVYKQLMDVNYLGTVALTTAVLPDMLQNGQGQIVAISSLVGKFGTPLRSGYAASKHALHGFFDSLRAEVEDRGIHVMLVCPGFIRTDISIDALTGDGRKQNKMDDAQAAGMPADIMAEKLIRGLQKGKREIHIGGKERFAILLKRFFPNLFARIIKRAKVT